MTFFVDFATENSTITRFKLSTAKLAWVRMLEMKSYDNIALHLVCEYDKIR